MFQIYFCIAAMIIVCIDIWAVIDVSKFSYKLRREKWMWTNIVLLLPLFGVFIYLFSGRNSLAEKEDEDLYL